MIQTETKIRSSKRNFLFALILLLVTNIMMGVTLNSMSKVTLREQIHQRMLDITNTAAFMIDGDQLKRLKAGDQESKDYQDVLTVLSAFKDNIQLEYIYCINVEKDGTFTFSVDPSVTDASVFGIPVAETEALRNASKGFAGVDEEPYTDVWGRFYSAYSPVYDSENNVVGVVAADFNADWYDSVLNSRRAATVILTMTALTIGIVLSFIIMSNNRKNFARMLDRLEALDRETQKLDKLILKSSIKKLDFIPESDSEVLRTLASGESGKKATRVEDYSGFDESINSLYKKLQKYMQYIEDDMYIDDSTGVKNKIAYKKKIQLLSDDIEKGSANFTVGFFDINGMKRIYARCGYVVGDKLLFDCAKMLKDVFGQDNVYHIVGDEFIVLLDKDFPEGVKPSVAKLEAEFVKYNEENKNRLIQEFSVSKGIIMFDYEKFGDYRSTFMAAKSRCDKEKDAYYEKLRKEEQGEEE